MFDSQRPARGAQICRNAKKAQQSRRQLKRIKFSPRSERKRATHKQIKQRPRLALFSALLRIVSRFRIAIPQPLRGRLYWLAPAPSCFIFAEPDSRRGDLESSTTDVYPDANCQSSINEQPWLNIEKRFARPKHFYLFVLLRINYYQQPCSTQS